MFPWFVTEHAARQYSRRVDRSVSAEEAHTIIARLLPGATLLEGRTSRGSERWSLPGVNAVIVGRPDPKEKVHVAVTTLGPAEYTEDVSDEVLEAYARTTMAPSEPIALVSIDPSSQDSTTAEPESRKLRMLRNTHTNLLAAHSALKTRYADGAHVIASAAVTVRRARDAEAKAIGERAMLTRALRIAVAGLRAASTMAPPALEALTKLETLRSVSVDWRGDD